MTKLREAIASPLVIAYAHYYPTEFLAIDKENEPGLLVADKNGLIAEGFIPLSDWTP